MTAVVEKLRRQLRRMEREGALEVDGPLVHLTNLDKVFWPQTGARKRDLIDYYLRVAPYILPHLRDRPLVMVRYPDGIGGEHWFHKDAPGHTPQWVRTQAIESRADRDARVVRYVVCDHLATLVWLAQLACIEIHTWSAPADAPDIADLAVFDIDPQTDDFADAVEGARVVCDLLQRLELPPYLKTTGKRGLHVFAPLKPQGAHQEVREFVHDAVRYLDRHHPGLLATSYVKAQRRGRCFIDYAQNSFGKTNVAPYSLRATPEATVSAPVRREELGRIGPADYRLDNIARRLGQVDELWADMRGRGRATAAAAHQRLRSLPD